MSKTRRQRSLEHPGKPKKGVRDLSRRVAGVHYEKKNPAAVSLGKLGGLAVHKVRGFQGMSPDKVKRIAALGVAARKSKVPPSDEGVELEEAV